MSAWGEPTEPCPYCGTRCKADWVDVEVGMVQCGPYHCMSCLASEIGPHDKKRPLSEVELRTGWYAPGEPPGSSANTFNGVIVDHKTARYLYEVGRLDVKEGDTPGNI